MMKSTILGVLAAVSLPALAFAAPTVQPSVEALAPAEQAATVEPSQDANPLITVREAESRNGRGRDRDRGRGRPELVRNAGPGATGSGVSDGDASVDSPGARRAGTPLTPNAIWEVNALSIDAPRGLGM